MRLLNLSSLSLLLMFACISATTSSGEQPSSFRHKRAAIGLLTNMLSNKVSMQNRCLGQGRGTGYMMQNVMGKMMRQRNSGNTKSDNDDEGSGRGYGGRGKGMRMPYRGSYGYPLTGYPYAPYPYSYPYSYPYAYPYGYYG